MDFESQDSAARDQLQAALSLLAEITLDTLIRTSELGSTLDFSDGASVFKRTLGLFAALAESNLDNVPVKTLNSLKARATAAASSFTQVREFNPDQASPAQVRDALIQQLVTQYESHFDHISPVIAYSVRKGTDFEALETKARDALETLEKSQDKQLAKIEKFNKESEEILVSIRRAAAEAGVSQHAIFFKQEADEHKTAAKLWLKITTLLGVGTLVLAVVVAMAYIVGWITLTPEHAFQAAIAKIVLFSILYFAIVWSGRNYRAHQHNYVVNKHRQNALGTFEAFVKAASDEATKNAVLLRSTEAIFSPGVSGYLAGEKDKSATAPQIIEILKPGIARHEG